MSGQYEFGLVDPAQTLVSGERTLGIEVTDGRLAAACGLGNIDPQHGDSAGPEAPAAIEAAVSWPLPPKGTRLVTLRPDLDALGAMAVFVMRQSRKPISDDIRGRIRRVAAADRFERGVWPGPRPLPTSAQDLLADCLDPEVAVMAACASDRSLDMAHRVAAIAAWLCTGTVSSRHEQVAHVRACRLVVSLQLGQTRVQSAAGGRITTVVSTEPGALGLGYRLAPVVVALNPEFGFSGGNAGRKYTVARWSTNDVDLAPVLAALQSGEPGWGGQAGIIGSPVEHPSRSPMEKVIACVTAAIENGFQRNCAVGL